MGFERESFDKLMKVVWGKKSQMQQAMSRDSKGEPFIIRELEFKGAQTPSQLATALKVTSGRISTLLAALEKKGRHFHKHLLEIVFSIPVKRMTNDVRTLSGHPPLSFAR